MVCHNVTAGDVWNPIGGGAGKGKTQAWVAFDCETSFCAAGTEANMLPETLPWESELTEGAGLAKTLTYRSHIDKMKVDLTCNRQSAAHWEGSLQPGAPAGEDKGTSSAHPGFLEYDQPGSGELVEPALGSTYPLTGTAKELGYAEQELIQVK
jgi:hypothetical protein